MPRPLVEVAPEEPDNPMANYHSNTITFPGGLSECFPKTYSYSSLT